MKIKRIFSAGFILAMAVLLCACGHEHRWREADCTHPQTCVGCGETVGVPLGHSWQAANYQDPELCSVCGARQGEAVKGSFERAGLRCNMQQGREYDYVTNCAADRSRQTVGKAQIEGYAVFDADNTHEKREGYQWQTVKLSVLFGDENARRFGPRYGLAVEDYYDSELLELSMKPEDGGAGSYSVSFHGDTYKVSYQITVDWSKTEDGASLMEAELTFSAPKGYDGIVIGLTNAAKGAKGTAAELADATSLYYRLGA